MGTGAPAATLFNLIAALSDAMDLVSSLLAIVYVWRVVETFYFAEPSKLARRAREAPLLMVVITWVVIAASVVFGIWTEYSAGMAAAAAADLLGGAP